MAWQPSRCCLLLFSQGLKPAIRFPPAAFLSVRCCPACWELLGACAPHPSPACPPLPVAHALPPWAPFPALLGKQHLLTDYPPFCGLYWSLLVRSGLSFPWLLTTAFTLFRLSEDLFKVVRKETMTTFTYWQKDRWLLNVVTAVIDSHPHCHGTLEISVCLYNFGSFQF